MIMTNKKVELRTNSEGETRRLGEIIGRNLDQGDIVALIGDLGSGKTCMTKGMAKSLGVSDQYEITSPTFTIINEYPGIVTFWHVDAYRLESSRDIIDAGFEDFFSSGGVVVIEWAEKILDILPRNALFISFEYVDETTRVVRISGRDSIIDLIMEGYKH
jgi:tRNA threonylcarbamoyladenosine biosynthesis protein TsaE